MSDELRQAAEEVLKSYDAYCSFWGDDGRPSSIMLLADALLGGDNGGLPGFEHRQVNWTSLERLRAAVATSFERTMR